MDKSRGNGSGGDDRTERMFDRDPKPRWADVQKEIREEVEVRIAC